MALFYNQPTAHRFGTALVKELELATWVTLDVGVAWVRRSGTRHILPAMHQFLNRGGVLRIAAGVDLENTSQEGLEDLLTLPLSGTAELYIYHDEANTTFHPKVYLFHNLKEAKLIIGSNNITEAGLYVNTEAGLEVNAPVTEPVIQDALAGLATWRDSSQGFALPLDSDLLRDLVAQGYVLPESSLTRRTRTPKTKTGPGGSSTVYTALFGRSKISRPPVPVLTTASPAVKAAATVPGQPTAAVKAVATSPGVPASTTTSGIGEVLIMRVRKAHIADRPTQTQMPKPVYESPFFAGVTSITSAHDGRSHRVITATARGIINTFKLEIPEMRVFLDPVIRLERTAGGIIYQAFDASSVLGRPIFAALERGLSMSPKTTNITKASSPETSTWWRYI